MRKRKKEKTNGLVGAKNRGEAGQFKEKRENKRISRGLKRWAGIANLRKKEKTNGLVGTDYRGARQTNLREKEKTNGLVGAKNRGRGGSTKEKRENEWISRG